MLRVDIGLFIAVLYLLTPNVLLIGDVGKCEKVFSNNLVY